MKYVEIVANQGSADTVLALAQQVKAQDIRFGVVGDDGLQTMRMLVSDKKIQHVLDTLQSLLGAQPSHKIVVLAIETALPRSDENGKAKKPESRVAIRETLYDEVEKNAILDANFLVLVMLSTIVAAFGLIENNIAVLVGAMVIAPLLGPNLALSLGATLGDTDLLKRAAKTLVSGTLLAIALAAILGFVWPSALTSSELLARTDVGFGDIVLALASGAAAALSLTTGLSSVLVGVMVAVALLPPAAALGIMLGQGNFTLALGATLLLAVNVASINLASKLVFLFKGISPRTWAEREKAKRSMGVYVTAWCVTLLVLVGIIFMRNYTVI